MALTMNFQVLGLSDKRADRIRQSVAEAFGERQGRWHVQLIGDRTGNDWEVKVSGPGVETSGLVSGSGDPEVVAEAVLGLAG